MLSSRRGARGLLVERGLVQVPRPRFAVQTPFPASRVRAFSAWPAGTSRRTPPIAGARNGLTPEKPFVGHVDLDSALLRSWRPSRLPGPART